MNTVLIGGDWGTSNLRVFRYVEGGLIAQTRSAPTGIMAVGGDGFEAAYRALVSDWLAEGPVPSLLCGMVGSRQGWIETPYAACPADMAAMADKVERADCDFGAVHILPGLCVDQPGLRHDVMRGEETQIFGAAVGAAAGGEGDAAELIVAPGTHSKWASLQGGRITDFSTYMTGELFTVLKTHSILGRLMDGDAHDADAFAEGVGLSLGDAALSRLLFSVRAEGLFHAIAPPALSAYLSGLLIGAEIGAGLAATQAQAVTLIGDPVLTGLYADALALAEVDDVKQINGEVAVGAGLWRLAGALGLTA